MGYTAAGSVGQVLTSSGAGTPTWSYLSPISTSTTTTSILTPVVGIAGYQIETSITALAINLSIANPTGTPLDGQKLIIRIKDNGVSYTIGWGSVYRAIGGNLPLATTATKITYIGCIYNSIESFWDVLAVSTQL